MTWLSPQFIKLRILWDSLCPIKMKGYKKFIPLFLDKKGIRIGGKLSSDEFQEYIADSAKVIEVNIVRERFGHLTNVDYLTDTTNLYFAGGVI